MSGGIFSASPETRRANSYAFASRSTAPTSDRLAHLAVSSGSLASSEDLPWVEPMHGATLPADRDYRIQQGKKQCHTASHHLQWLAPLPSFRHYAPYLAPHDTTRQSIDVFDDNWRSSGANSHTCLVHSTRATTSNTAHLLSC